MVFFQQLSSSPSTVTFLPQPGLRCFKREPGTADPVPYCDGGESDALGKDYCTERGVNGDLLWLSKVADNGRFDDDGSEIRSDRLLKMCEGDCDSDDDCDVRKVYTSI